MKILARAAAWLSVFLVCLLMPIGKMNAQTLSNPAAGIITGSEQQLIFQNGGWKRIAPPQLLGGPLPRLKAAMQAALTSNPYDLPDFGAGPTAGQTVPTVTASGTVTAANTKQYSLDDADLSWVTVTGGTPVIASAATPNLYGFPVVANSTGAIASTGKAGVLYGIEFCTDDPTPNFRIGYNNTYSYRFSVDGQFLNRAPTAIPNPNSGNNFFFQIAFGSRKWRCIKFESEGQVYFRSLSVLPTSRVAAPRRPNFVRVAIVSDSYVAYQTQAGTANSFAGDNYGGGLAKVLGWTDPRLAAVAATGVSADGTGNSSRFASAARMADVTSLCALPGGLDLIVIPGSINDRAVSTTQIDSDLTAMLRTFNASCPGVPIIVTGMPAGATGPAATSSPSRPSIKRRSRTTSPSRETPVFASSRSRWRPRFRCSTAPAPSLRRTSPVSRTSTFKAMRPIRLSGRILVLPARPWAGWSISSAAWRLSFAPRSLA